MELLKGRSYFIVHLKTGEVFDFNKKCEYISNLDEGMPRFYTTEKQGGILLGLVPRDNISYIDKGVE